MESITQILTVSAIISAANPLENIKSRIQTMNELVDRGSIKQKYKGIFDCAKSIKINQGIRALWKGNSISLVRFFPNQKINYDVKNHFKSYVSTSSLASNFGAGIVGGWAAAAIMYPIDTIRIFISTSMNKSSKTVLQLFAKLKNEGGKFLFKGYSSSLLNIALFRGTYFGMFDSLKIKASNQNQKWIAAYISGLCAGFIVYPIETLRKKKILCNKSSSYYEIFKKTGKNQGIKGFYRGSILTPLQSISGAALLMYFERKQSNL